MILKIVLKKVKAGWVGHMGVQSCVCVCACALAKGMLLLDYREYLNFSWQKIYKSI